MIYGSLLHMYGKFSTSNFFRYAKSDCPLSPVEPIELTQKKHFARENLPVENYIYVQYWQSDSDGQIYFSMVQMDPSDKQVLRRRNDSWEADVSKRACPMDPSDNPMDI